ncbi:alpha/beta hydrolase family protein [Dactylosporangium sp. CA-139066]|uniref:alpha/beta hydrolase family protein n=1 Tax=Dactylosporangium sp. CA-139066 TaxID=3239930 RepID=UPI003D8F9591
MTDRWQFDPDPSLRPAARTPEVRFDSDGIPLLGVLHVPAGPGPHPIAVLLHGFPGNERNFDLAQALRRAGYAALVFHYRGSWGVGGEYSWRNVLADAARAVAAARELAPDHALDPARVALVGHSLGGFAALMTAAADPSVRAVAALASFDFGAVSQAPEAVRREAHAMFGSDLLPLRGTSADALLAELDSPGAGAAWRLAGLGPRLAGRPVLLVAAGNDTVAEPALHHAPVVEAYRSLDGFEELTLPSDHAFSGHRVALTRAVIDFLDRRLIGA